MKNSLTLIIIVGLSFISNGQTINMSANKYESGPTQIVVTNSDKITYAVVELFSKVILYKHKDGKVVGERELPAVVKIGKEKLHLNYSFFSFNDELHVLKQSVNKKSFENEVEVIRIDSDDLNKDERSDIHIKFTSKNNWRYGRASTSDNGKYLLITGLEKFYYLYNTNLELVREKESAPIKSAINQLYVSNKGEVIGLFYQYQGYPDIFNYNFTKQTNEITIPITIYIFKENDEDINFSIKPKGLVNNWVLAQSDSGNIAVAGYSGEVIRAKKNVSLGLETIQATAIEFKLFDKNGKLISEESVPLNMNYDLLRIKKLVYLKEAEQYAVVGEEIEMNTVVSDDKTKSDTRYAHGSIAVNFFDEFGEPSKDAFIYRRNEYHPFDEKTKGHIEGLIIHSDGNKVVLAFNSCQEYMDIKSFEDKAPVFSRSTQACVYTISPNKKMSSHLVVPIKNNYEFYQTTVYSKSTTSSKIYCMGFDLIKTPIFEVVPD